MYFLHCPCRRVVRSYSDKMANYNYGSPASSSSNYYAVDQPPQPGGLFSRHVPGMTGAARTMAAMQPDADDFDRETTSTESIELQQQPAAVGSIIGLPQQQQQQQHTGETMAGYSDDDDDVDLYGTSGHVTKMAARCGDDTETMTTKSDAESRIRFRFEGSDGEDRSMSGETEVQPAKSEEEEL